MKAVRGVTSASVEQTSDALRKAASAQGYTLAEGESQQPTVLVFKKGVTLVSWGSELRATLASEGSSTSVTFTAGETFAITDWGRGKRAATRLLTAIGATLASD
jgi:hypothetical protein